jgi:hypothetical protein
MVQGRLLRAPERTVRVVLRCSSSGLRTRACGRNSGQQVVLNAGQQVTPPGFSRNHDAAPKIVELLRTIGAAPKQEVGR